MADERPQSPETDQRIISAGDKIALIALDTGLSKKPNTEEVTRITFGSILNQISAVLLNFPETDRPERRKKLMRVLDAKFTEQLGTVRKSSIEEREKKLLISLVSVKIASWMEGILDETEIELAKERARDAVALWKDQEEKTETMLETPVMEDSSSPQTQRSDVYKVTPGITSAFEVQNLAKSDKTENRATMTEIPEGMHVWDFLKGPGTELNARRSSEVRNWLQWISGVMLMAEDWAAWINRTVADAEEKVAKKRGEAHTEQGEVVKLTKKEWHCWTEGLSKDAKNYTRINKTVQKTAVEWRRWFDTLSKLNLQGPSDEQRRLVTSA